MSYIYIKRAAQEGVILLLIILLYGCGKTASTKSKYYVVPRESYTITDPDFDFLEEETIEKIESLLQKTIEWYNAIDYSDEIGTITLEDVDDDDLRTKWHDLIDDRTNLYNRKKLIAISPATDAYSDFSAYVVNNDNTITTGKNGDVNYSISIKSDEWMKIHDDLLEALEFYYGDGDHSEMLSEEDTHYKILSERDRTYLMQKLDAKLTHENWLERVNTNYEIDVEENKMGGLKIIYKKYIYETKSEFLNEGSYSKEVMVETYQKIWNLLDSVTQSYESSYTSVDLDVEVYGTNGDLLIWVNEDGATYAH